MMGISLTRGDKWQLFGVGCTLVAGLWVLWNSDISSINIIMHIKFVYSLFLTLAIFIAGYYIVIKDNEVSNNGKKK